MIRVVMAYQNTCGKSLVKERAYQSAYSLSCPYGTLIEKSLSVKVHSLLSNKDTNDVLYKLRELLYYTMYRVTDHLILIRAYNIAAPNNCLNAI
jgi:hypothetical protein